jgi:transcription elongation factor
MDTPVQQLLRLVPGLLFSGGRSYFDNVPVGHLIYDQVPPSDVIATLTPLTPPLSKPYEAGKWVKVLRGLYKGDIGIISSVGSTGCATVLLVPRLQPPIKGLKRKRIHRPSPQLFDPQVVKAAFDKKPVPGGDHIWRFNGSTFDHGLLRKKVKPGSAVPDVLVPSDVGILFALSKHPICGCMLRDMFPRPLEWDFSPRDKVILVSGSREGQKAIVTAVEEHTLEVELSTGEVTSVSWSAAQKDIGIGTFIKVLHGTHSGETGWVDRVDDGVVYFVQKDGNKNDRDSVKASLPIFNQCSLLTSLC